MDDRVVVGRCGTLTVGGPVVVREFKRVNSEKLKAAEAHFLQMHPDGFADEAMQSVRKKHNVDKLITYANETITKANCNRRNSLLRPFEYHLALIHGLDLKSLVQGLHQQPLPEKQAFAHAIEQRMFGRKAKGLMRLLACWRISNWPMVFGSAGCSTGPGGSVCEAHRGQGNRQGT